MRILVVLTWRQQAKLASSYAHHAHALLTAVARVHHRVPQRLLQKARVESVSFKARLRQQSTSLESPVASATH